MPLCFRRSLGVTLWELFEFGAQPYRHLSDEEVLAFVVRQQHVKLARPRLKLPYADYWLGEALTPDLSHVTPRWSQQPHSLHIPSTISFVPNVPPRGERGHPHPSASKCYLGEGN